MANADVQEGQIAPDEDIQPEEDATEETAPGDENDAEESKGRFGRGQRMGYAGVAIKSWELSSHLSFLLGATCYIVNGVYWLKFVKRDKNPTTTAIPAVFNMSNASNASSIQEVAYDADAAYYAYYEGALEKFAEGPVKWWELAGALFYMINPLLEFGTGTLKDLCGKKCCNQPTFADAFWSLPWMPIAKILFLMGSFLYLLNVFVPFLSEDDEWYGEAGCAAGTEEASDDFTPYSVIDFFAAMIFLLDSLAYLFARLSRKRQERGSSDETSFLCCGSAYRGMLHVDWGFWGDVFFIIGAILETIDHYCFLTELNLVAAILWWCDAALYIVEWVLVHKLYIGRVGNRTSVEDDADGVEMQSNPVHDGAEEGTDSD